jgi:hypothetical protein
MNWLTRRGSAVIAMLASTAGTHAADAKPPTHVPPSSEHIATLVHQLGHESFPVRERASTDLIRLGRAAKPALLAGLGDTDLEVRRRCQFILPLALRRDLEARLAAFLADKDHKNDHGLPGWARYHELVGNGDIARDLFIQISKADPDLLEAVATEPKAAGDRFTYRCQFLQQLAYNPTGNGTMVSLADLANLLFIATDPMFQMPAESLHLFTNLLTYQMPQRLTPGARAELVKKLALRWIQRQDASNLGQTLELAVKLNLKESLDLALREVRNKNGVPYSRAMAIMAVGQLGGKQHATELEPLLAETAQVGSFGINNTQGNTEVRDVALATLIHLHGQKLKDYGFAAAEAWPDTEISLQNGPIFLGFSNKNKRELALKKWKGRSGKEAVR